ncbi:ferritin-like domain-containing protein [Streptomyces sp. LP11]|uniref:Ferritin-like domain-containing protein n=1 Tax=Streptomyces pyxinicus TaxID=2970331 RepID=A0ABT2BBQ1_9ACTN|nr:ferritin-like domain-containing protein [Streptomyces sp. LP11]MCS0605953.1 ferritin-like domain-containing protein [Streptomyces sp. LP11]
MSGRASEAELSALQGALAAEHAAVYGYGVVGGLIGSKGRTQARAAYDAHRAGRDALVREVRDMGGEPVAASAAYALPFPVADSAAAGRLAARLEERLAGAYADLVRATTGTRRSSAAGALRAAAVRAARWSGESVAFPGLSERSTEEDTGAAGTTPTASASR